MEIANKDEFYELMNNNKHVVLDFYGEHCGPCKQIMPLINNMTEKYKDKVSIVKVNVNNEDVSDIVRDYGIRNIPTLLFFTEKNIVNKSVGLINEDALTEKINSML